jgi:hypothetical protein
MVVGRPRRPSAIRLTMCKRTSAPLSLAALVLIWAVAAAHAEQTPGSDDIALGGYDVVSYWAARGPVQGSTAITAVYAQRVYQFSNVTNRAQFLADPKRYLPRYDGWCATSLSMGRLSVPDYTNFKIEDDSLLLFEHNGFTNGRTLWDTDPSGFRARADQHAAELLK